MIFMHIIVGFLIGLLLTVAFHQLDVLENRKDCEYDPETRSWHKSL